MSLLFTFLLISLSLVIAKGYEGHSGDIAYVLGYSDVYDKDGFNNVFKGRSNISEDEKTEYYIVCNAVRFSIDYQGINLDRSYTDLKNDLTKKGSPLPTKLPSLLEFDKLGGGAHRAYCHQGFYHQYNDDAKKQKRWELGRDKVLIPSIQAAFDIPENEKYRAEALSIIFYYIHLAGDLVEGEESSVKQMFPDFTNTPCNISSFWSISNKLVEDLRTCFRKYHKNINLPNTPKLNNNFGTDKNSQFESFINFVRYKLSDLIKTLIGESYNAKKIA